MWKTQKTTTKVLELIHEFSKAVGYLKNKQQQQKTQNSIAFVYINNETEEKGVNPIYNCTKNHKIPRLKSNQRGKVSVFKTIEHSKYLHLSFFYRPF